MTAGQTTAPDTSPAAISLDSLAKAYGERVAVDGISLQVSSGELVAVLGPNGAGKTTTLEMAEGYRRPDRGTVRVLGLDPLADGRRLRPLVGIMLQEGGVYPALTVAESIRLFAAYFAHPENSSELLETVGLKERAGTAYRKLSGGEKQRLSLALALVGRPRVLFLDEPTAGMDPRARALTWELIEDRRRRGVTVVLTTHSMEEAERLADRVAIVSRGRLVACDSPAGLLSASRPEVVHLELDGKLPAGKLAKLRGLDFVSGVEELDGSHYLVHSSHPPQVAAAATALLLEGGPRLRQLRVGSASLEQVFLELTEGSET